MSRIARTALAVILGIPTVAQPSAARGDADTDITYQLETSIASSYVSRGIPQYSSRTVPSSQSTAALRIDEVHGGALSLGVWSAVAIDSYREQPGTAVELDLSVAYEHQRGPMTLTAGYAACLFPEHDEGSPLDGAHEVSAVVSLATPYVVPTASAYLELARQQGVYLSLGASRDLRHDDWTFSPAVSLGGATYRKYGGGEQSAAPHLNDVTAAVSARRELTGGLYASAKLSYSLFGTPTELLAMESAPGFNGRSSVFGVLAFGVSR